MTSSVDKLAVLVRIRGRVQGVGYRAWTVRTAQALGLQGWVRNRSDGTVEALFAGESGIIDQMLAACQTGPALAKVIKIDILPAEYPAKTGFDEVPTL